MESKEQKTIFWLTISTSALAVLCGILLTWNVLRPVVETVKVVEPKVPEPEKVVLDLGGGRKIEAPASGVVEFSGNLDSLTDPRKTSVIDSAAGKGIRVSSAGDTELDLDFTAPIAKLPDGGEGIAGAANLGVKNLLKNGGSALYALAGLAIVAGFVVLIWLKQVKLGMGLIVGGITLLATVYFFQTYPWVLWIFLLAALGVAGFIFYDYWKNGRKSHTLDAVVAAAENMPDKFKSLFKKYVRGEMQARGIEGFARKEVEAVKRNGGMPRASMDTTNDELELAETIVKKVGKVPQAQPQVIVVPQNGGQVVYTSEDEQ